MRALRSARSNFNDKKDGVSKGAEQIEQIVGCIEQINENSRLAVSMFRRSQTNLVSRGAKERQHSYPFHEILSDSNMLVSRIIETSSSDKSPVVPVKEEDEREDIDEGEIRSSSSKLKKPVAI